MESNEGWWWPLNSRKAHYMVGARSLCGGWLALAKVKVEAGNDRSPDNCAACKKKLAKKMAVRDDHTI